MTSADLFILIPNALHLAPQPLSLVTCAKQPSTHCTRTIVMSVWLILCWGSVFHELQSTILDTQTRITTFHRSSRILLQHGEFNVFCHGMAYQSSQLWSMPTGQTDGQTWWFEHCRSEVAAKAEEEQGPLASAEVEMERRKRAQEATKAAKIAKVLRKTKTFSLKPSARTDKAKRCSMVALGTRTQSIQKNCRYNADSSARKESCRTLCSLLRDSRKPYHNYCP